MPLFNWFLKASPSFNKILRLFLKPGCPVKLLLKSRYSRLLTSHGYDIALLKIFSAKYRSYFDTGCPVNLLKNPLPDNSELVSASHKQIE